MVSPKSEDYRHGVNIVACVYHTLRNDPQFAALSSDQIDAIADNIAGQLVNVDWIDVRGLAFEIGDLSRTMRNRMANGGRR